MLKNLTREARLIVQARTGASAALFVWLCVMAVAFVTAFVFLCVSGYEWLAARVGSVYAALIMAGIFIAIALISAAIGAMIRRRVRERAILARAAKAHAPAWLLDQRVLGVAMEAGRTLGWQRLVPVALLGVMAVQWAREFRARDGEREPHNS